MECSSLFIEGTTLIYEIGKEKTFKKLFIKEGIPFPSYLKTEELYFVSEELFAKLSGVKSPEWLGAEVALPSQQPLRKKRLLVAFDQISDPGNLGTLIRSSLALGFEGALITKSSVDPFNEKAIRASKGAIFHLPYELLEEGEFLSLIRKQKEGVYFGDPKGQNIDEIPLSFPLILILGNEAGGVSDKVKAFAKGVSIPISSSMESLNVACAGSILMNKIREKQ